MMDKDNKTTSLRKKAEKKLLQKENKSPGTLAHQDINKIIHELQVHQIELELQNDELRKSHIELEESRTKYADLYDFAPAGYFTFDSNGLILELNLTGAVLLMKEKTALINRPFSDFIHKDDQDIFFIHRKKAFNSHGRQTSELRLKSDGGSFRYARLESIPVKDKEGNFDLLRTIVSDITKHRRIEQKLFNSEKKYKALIETTDTGFVIIDEKGKVTDANSQYVKITAHDKFADIFGREILEWTADHDRERFAGAMNSCEEGSVRRLEIDCINRAGQIVPLEINATAMETSEGRRCIALVRDITERIKIQTALKLSEEEWVRTFDTIPDLIMIIDNQYKIKKANKALADRLGIARDELAGRTCYKVLHGIDEPPSYCPHIKVLADGKEHVEEIYEETLRDHFIQSASPVYDADGNQTGVVEVFREITARKEMEEQLKVSAITDELTGLLNRRGFFALAEQQCKIANRSKRRMMLLYMDIDDMKKINDELGHASGDQALWDTANVINKTFRDSDVKGRIGGDEFAVLLTDPASDAEQSIVKHFHENLQTCRNQGKRDYILSISMGFSHFDPDHSCSVEKLLVQADRAMYEDKKK